MSVKYKKPYDWLEEDDTNLKEYDPDPNRIAPEEINIGAGN